MAVPFAIPVLAAPVPFPGLSADRALFAEVQRNGHQLIDDREYLCCRVVRALVQAEVRGLLVERNAGLRALLRGELRERRLLRRVLLLRLRHLASELREE